MNNKVMIKLAFLALFGLSGMSLMAQKSAAGYDDGINEYRGNKGGGQGQHRGQRSRTYKNVKSVEIFSINGERVYAYGVDSPAKGKSEKALIDRVEKKSVGVKLIFNANTQQEKVIEILCANCILIVNYNTEDQQ